MLWFILFVLLLLFLLDYIFTEMLSTDIKKEIYKISRKILDSIVEETGNLTLNFILAITIGVFISVFLEEIVFRFIPALIVMSFGATPTLLLLTLIVFAFLDAYIHKIDAEKLIGEKVSNLYFVSIFIMQTILAFAFYHIFMISVASNPFRALLNAFILTTMIHFAYDFLCLLMLAVDILE